MGELAIDGIYPLAYIRMLMRAEVQSVFALAASMFHQVNVDNEVEGLATVTLEMKRGLVGTLCIGRIGAASHPDIGEIKLHLLGCEGGLVIGEFRPEVGVYYRSQADQEFRRRRVTIDNNYELMHNLAEAIDHDGETILDARAGRAIAAALESSRSGKPVRVR